MFFFMETIIQNTSIHAKCHVCIEKCCLRFKFAMKLSVYMYIKTIALGEAGVCGNE